MFPAQLSFKQKNVFKNRKLNCLRANKIYFFCLGTSKTLSLGEFDGSYTHLFLIHFSSMFLKILDLFVCPIMEYSPTFCFASVSWKKRENMQKRSKKVENVAVCVATYKTYVATQNSSRP